MSNQSNKNIQGIKKTNYTKKLSKKLCYRKRFNEELNCIKLSLASKIMT